MSGCSMRLTFTALPCWLPPQDSEVTTKSRYVAAEVCLTSRVGRMAHLLLTAD
jgi:hypothetical protein